MEWIDRLAEELGEEPVSPAEMGLVLKLAREVAHGVERKLAPVSTFLAGVHAGRGMAEGGSREDPVRRAVSAALRLVPERDLDAVAGSGAGPEHAAAERSDPR
jgi:hypothetical protein